MSRTTRSTSAVLPVLASLAVLIALGFGAKLYRGPGQFWINNSIAGVFYEIFWCLFVFLLARRARPTGIAAGVLVVTCGLEVLQLWNPPPLHAIRSTFLGASLLGTTFARSDFAYYVVGCGAGWAWMRGLRKRAG